MWIVVRMHKNILKEHIYVNKGFKDLSREVNVLQLFGRLAAYSAGKPR